MQSPAIIILLLFQTYVDAKTGVDIKHFCLPVCHHIVDKEWRSSTLEKSLLWRVTDVTRSLLYFPRIVCPPTYYSHARSDSPAKSKSTALARSASCVRLRGCQQRVVAGWWHPTRVGEITALAFCPF